MPTIKDVASLAGVGIATVSRVLNNSGYVKSETRKRILQVIDDIGYVPNEIARNLSSKKSHIVAFVLPHTRHIFFSELLFHVEEALFKHGYKMMVCNSSENIEKELSYLEMLGNNKVDAVILLTNNDIAEFLKPNMKIISFDRRFDGYPFVASDNFKGGQLAAQRLINQGCKKLLYIGDDSAQGSVSKVITEVSKRRQGFRDVLKKHPEIKLKEIVYPLRDYILKKEELMDLIGNDYNFDGVFAISDSIANTMIKVLTQKGKKVPNDVKVIGFDGVAHSLNNGIEITTIKQNIKRLGEALVELIQRYDEIRKDEHIMVDVELLIGDSA
jgi:LacI family transcriptional regulator